MAGKFSKVIRNMSSGTKQSIAIILIFLIIILYVAISCMSVFNVGIKTQTALETTVYETVDTKALAVREEHIVAGSGGITIASASGGAKVDKGGELAKVFSSEENAKAYADYMQLSQQLAYYTDMQAKAVGQATDIESLDRDIIRDINSYVSSASKNRLDSACEYSSQLNDKLTRRQLIIGEQIDFMGIISEIEGKMNEININSCAPSGLVNADESGVFSSCTDGLEQAYSYKDILSFDCETLKKYISDADGAGKSDAMGKLVTKFTWYFCCVVNPKDFKDYADGSRIDVAVAGTDDVYRCKIISGLDTQLGAEETVLILECSEMNEKIAAFRVEDISIRIKEHKGIKVSSKAVRIKTLEDGTRTEGVYALVSSIVKWRDAEVLYRGSDYVVLSYEKDKSGGIKLYDQIIIQGKELYDGRVYS